MRATVDWHVFNDQQSLFDALSAVVLGVIDERHAAGLPAWLLLSGGSTPAPLYQALAPVFARKVSDGANLVLGIVDDRWVEPDSPGSNARMMRETLLVPGAAQPRFRELCLWEQGLDESVRFANQHHLARRFPPDLVLFGMGDDAHTASLFPGSADLSRVMAAREPYAALDATGCPVAGPYTRRITLTPFGWSHCRRRLLLIRGQHKRQVLEQALQATDPLHHPILSATEPAAFPLQVYWAP
jgi:6-phosphogluconolactonase